MGVSSTRGLYAVPPGELMGRSSAPTDQPGGVRTPTVHVPTWDVFQPGQPWTSRLYTLEDIEARQSRRKGHPSLARAELLRDFVRRPLTSHAAAGAVGRRGEGPLLPDEGAKVFRESFSQTAYRWPTPELGARRACLEFASRKADSSGVYGSVFQRGLEPASALPALDVPRQRADAKERARTREQLSLGSVNRRKLLEARLRSERRMHDAAAAMLEYQRGAEVAPSRQPSWYRGL